MTATPRLYFDDPLLVSFRARVARHDSLAGRTSVVLERTAFYPEAGGQMADRGSLAGTPVEDVQSDDAGVVHHFLAGPLPEPGSEVLGEIDRARRRSHMALHTGQHVLSAALLEVVRGDTVSARLGETGCTIDIDQPRGLPERELAAAEALANSVIDDDLPIRAFFPSPEELAALTLRREPKVDDNVRVVTIGEFDTSPCGGTHCTRSAQVGFIRVLGLERYKGKHRIHFEAGRRARELTSRDSALLRALGVSFACGPAEVPGAVDRLRGELKQARGALEDAQAELAEHAALALLARAAGGPVVAEVEPGLLRPLAKRLGGEPGSLAFLAACAEAGLDIVVVRGPGSDFDCGGFVKRVTAQTGGRGGGRPERAEGRLPAGADWLALVAAR